MKWQLSGQYGKTKIHLKYRSIKGYYCEPCALFYDEAPEYKNYFRRAYSGYNLETGVSIYRLRKNSDLATCSECHMVMKQCSKPAAKSKVTLKPHPLLAVLSGETTLGYIQHAIVAKYRKLLPEAHASYDFEGKALVFEKGKARARFYLQESDYSRDARNCEPYKQKQIMELLGMPAIEPESTQDDDSATLALIVALEQQNALLRQLAARV